MERDVITDGFFYDSWEVKKAENELRVYNIDCNVHQDVVVYTYVTRGYLKAQQRPPAHDTLSVLLMQEMKMKPIEFIHLLEETNKIERNNDTTFFIKYNMQCTWRMFDEMYNRYIND